MGRLHRRFMPTAGDRAARNKEPDPVLILAETFGFQLPVQPIGPLAFVDMNEIQTSPFLTG